MTPAQYPEQRFRYRQTDPVWGKRLLGDTKSTMTRFGCVVTSTAYIISRWRVKDLTPGDWLTWLNTHIGFSADLLLWKKVDEFSKGKLVYTTDATNRSYTMRNVFVMGTNRALFSHWVVELSGGLMFDPLDGNIKDLSSYSPILDAAKKINRRYFLKK